MTSAAGPRARWAFVVLFLALPALGLPVVGNAQAHFLSATDRTLRADILLLADEGVIYLPTSAWPLPAADVSDAIGRIDVDSIAEPALQAALLRVRSRVALPVDAGDWALREVRVAGGRPGVLRDYGTLARDSFEVQSTGGVTNDRWSLTLAATGVGSPDDGRHLRLDGSDLSLRWGNWLFSANQMDRWWGPGWDGSLILSTNARPMPGVSLDRMRSTPFDFPVLRWLGPWRFTGFLGRADKYRPDVDEALFMAMRVSFKPVSIVEVGLSRTAQFCGRGRPCGAKTFWNVLAGNDNAGQRVAPEDEPGNQLAGLDLRIASPFKALPFAIYTQLIGEDASSSGIPERYLGQFGLETWALLDSGSTLRTRIEYSNTNCKFSAPKRSFGNCAYRQGIFQAGYRFHDRNLGHTVDADSESISAMISLQANSGDEWAVRIQRALLDRYNGIDQYNAVTRGPGEYRAGEISWRGTLFGQDLSAQLGFEDHDAGAAKGRSGAYGTVQWRLAL